MDLVMTERNRLRVAIRGAVKDVIFHEAGTAKVAES
jgi:hypothetical protein